MVFSRQLMQLILTKCEIDDNLNSSNTHFGLIAYPMATWIVKNVVIITYDTITSEISLKAGFESTIRRPMEEYMSIERKP